MAATMRCLRVYRRSWDFCQVRCSRLASSEPAPVTNEEPNSFYPPIKPKYPPGKWGAMTPGYAWLWHKHQEESLAIPEVQARIKALCEKEMTQLYFPVQDERPRTLDYKKYITKTRVLNGLPDIYSSLDSTLLDELTSKLSPLVCDLIVMETDQLLRRTYLGKFKRHSHQHHRVLTHLLLRSTLLQLITQLREQFPHLSTSQYDESVQVSALWDRHGVERSRKRLLRPETFKYEMVNDTRVTSSTSVDFVLRAENPLPQFAERDLSVLEEGELDELKYHPRVYGQHYDKVKCSVEAGHVWGDPCEFGSLAVLNTGWTWRLAEKYGASHAEEASLCQGLAASFVWLLAQAHNQGFNTLIDMTYPLTTQTILTDGHTWQFMAYQLNTLQLWKDNDANDLVNLCWVGEPTQLFEGVEEGKVVGFNPEVLRQLIACLVLSPAERPYDLRPTLPPVAVNPREKDTFIPLKKERVVVEEAEKYVVE